jgi:multidrug efflux pump subunit AcrB
MVRNRVTPNILMLAFLVGGLVMSTRIKQEVFPEFDLDEVVVRVPYPGASPEEVEQGIVLSVEEAIRGLEGVVEVTAVAAEGAGTVTAELVEGVDRQKVYQDIRQEVDRIRTFPEDSEEPEVTLTVRKRGVLELQVSGDVDEWTLRAVAEDVRDRLLQHPGITQIELKGARDYEISVEVSEEALRRHGLTLEDVSAKLRQTAVEIPGGKIETEGGEILLRVTERRDWAREFRRIPIVTAPDGTSVNLGEIASVTEGFEDSDEESVLDGRRTIEIEVFRIGEQTPIGVSDAVHEAMASIEDDLPPGVDWIILNDRSDVYRQRLELLLRNAFTGLLLVLVLLGLFLEVKLAFWVTMGIPTAFLGCMLFLPLMDVSINMISLFAFIIALGIVVDDAIVAGENIFEYRQQGMSLVDAAIRGARDVLTPIAFAILTNIVAFIPLYFVPGMMGKVWRVVPLVVCTAFAISLIEAIWILPAHLAHSSARAHSRLGRAFAAFQGVFNRLFFGFVNNVYGPSLRFALRYRQLTIAGSVAILLLALGYLGSGRLGFILMPKAEADFAAVTATLPYGSPMARAREVRDRLLAAAGAVVREGGGEKLSLGVLAHVRENSVEARIYLTSPDLRPVSTAEVTRRWRERVGALPGLEALKFESDRGGPGGGAALTVELSHRDIPTLDRASEALAERLAEFKVVKDIDDGTAPGKQQLNLRVTPEGESLNLTAREIAAQVRHAFQGSEAIRQQRGRNEVTVRVRRPEAERVNEFDVERMIVLTPGGGQAPLLSVASVDRGRAYTSINRRDGRRTVSVTADVDPIGESSRVKATLDSEILPALAADFPGLTYGYQGRQADMKESLDALIRGLLLSLLAIYVLLAVPFRSYVQPLIVMLAIPFGIVGAALGHLIMGYDLSIISIMGIVALAGVVVNDSLVLIEYTNRRVREAGLSPREAMIEAGLRRFRPVLLTTLTTFGGLAPMIFETSRQARFMIPMALSLGFGILFATFITLMIVPAMYLVFIDAKRFLDAAARRLFAG